MPKTAERLSKLPPYVFSVIGDRLRQMSKAGIDVIRLDIGSPDLPPPSDIVDALEQSARDPKKHGYTGYRGLADFRLATANYYQQRFNVDLNPDTEVLPLIGSKEGIVNLTMAYIDKGDIALVPNIGYPSYAMGAYLAGGEPYEFELDPVTFAPNLANVPADILKRAKLLWINYPNNPTGATLELDQYQELATFCQKHDILLVSDNPYMDVVFDGYIAPSALQVADRTHVIEFYSFSKSYNMAGWRLGVALGSAEAIDNLLTIKSNIDSGHFQAIYEAGIAAYKTPQSWIDERNAIYAKRRDMIMETLPHIGLTAQKPKGSLYVWAKTDTMSASQYVERALTEAHVSIAPGGAYGNGGHDYIRISLGISDSRLQQALDRLKSWYQG
jgi:LL-diaminopimelate aminotransferase